MISCLFFKGKHLFAAVDEKSSCLQLWKSVDATIELSFCLVRMAHYYCSICTVVCSGKQNVELVFDAS